MGAITAYHRGAMGFHAPALSGRLVEVLREMAEITGEMERLNPGISVTTNIAIMSDPRMIELQTGLLQIARAKSKRAAKHRRALAQSRHPTGYACTERVASAHDRMRGDRCGLTARSSPASPTRSKATGARSPDLSNCHRLAIG